MLEDKLRAIGEGDADLGWLASCQKGFWRNPLSVPRLTGRAAQDRHQQGGGKAPPNGIAGRMDMPPESVAALPPNGSRISCGALKKDQVPSSARAASFMRLLGGGENSAADCSRQGDEREELRRVEIVLP